MGNPETPHFWSGLLVKLFFLPLVGCSTYTFDVTKQSSSFGGYAEGDVYRLKLSVALAEYESPGGNAALRFPQAMPVNEKGEPVKPRLDKLNLYTANPSATSRLSKETVFVLQQIVKYVSVDGIVTYGIYADAYQKDWKAPSIDIFELSNIKGIDKDNNVVYEADPRYLEKLNASSK